jgi:DNA-binding NarL/FixJ family response regulator
MKSSPALIRVVIVEDQVMFLHLLSRMLRAYPELQLVGTANSCKEGIALCRDTLPDLLVLDLGMPDGDGLDVARALIDSHAMAKVLVLSSMADTFTCPDWLHDNLFAVMDKMLAYETLEAHLQTLISLQTNGEHPLSHLFQPKEILSPREFEIFEMIGRGLISKEIGIRLNLSIHTIQVYRKRMAEKLGTTGSQLSYVAVRYYHTQGFLQNGEK